MVSMIMLDLMPQTYTIIFNCRLKETFKCLVDMMDKQGLAMQSRFQKAELLIFTSAKLTQSPYGEFSFKAYQIVRGHLENLC